MPRISMTESARPEVSANSPTGRVATITKIEGALIAGFSEDAFHKARSKDPTFPKPVGYRCEGRTRWAEYDLFEFRVWFARYQARLRRKGILRRWEVVAQEKESANV